MFERKNLQRGAVARAAHTPILRPGDNCWRVERAYRAAMLVDGADYFKAVREAIKRAQSQILILAWDIDSRLQLDPGARDGLPATLGDFLNAVVGARPGLQAYVLAWDFAVIYILEREWLPVYKLGWRTHRRLHFHLDGRHPAGASHHQKIVVVDDAVAFSGGLDLCKWRWDTPDHRPDNALRVDAEGIHYPPFHDVQMLVDGAAARALGTLTRMRWQGATGMLPPTAVPQHDPWPAEVMPDFRDVDIAVARTEPVYGGRTEVREVERSYLDMIAAAQNHLYLESQYFTSERIGAALAARLASPRGPEVVLVLPLRTGGWLERHTMDVLRRRLLAMLRQADRYGRLRVYYPDVPGLHDACINVHAKILIADDTWLRVGSANLSNRSMGLDTECDLIIEAHTERLRAAVRRCRARLLGEHLGTEPETVDRALRAHGSLVRAVESLCTPGRSLRPMVIEPRDAGIWMPNAIDPEKPVDPDTLADQFLSRDEREPAGRRVVFGSALVMALAALAAAWRWTPLQDWLRLEQVLSAIAMITDASWSPLAVLAAYLISGLLAVPVSLMALLTILVFGPIPGMLYALGGATASAAFGFALGHLLGRNTVRQLASARLNRLTRRLASRGLIAVITIRLLPVAPFGVVNIMAGASSLGCGVFLLGTVIGLVPGVLALTLIAERIVAAVRHPDAATYTLLVLTGAAVAATAGLIWRWLAPRRLAPRPYA